MIEILPDARYRVQLDAGYEVLGLHGRPHRSRAVGARSPGSPLAWRPNNPFRSISVIEFDMNAKPADRETVTFDYGIPAELFMGKRKGGARQPLRYRRFATAAEAIRFAIEELPAVRALSAWMQVGDQRFDGDDIQRLYLFETATRSRAYVATGVCIGSCQLNRLVEGARALL